MLAIISNPGIYNRLRQEIDNAIAERIISFPIRSVEAKRLTYLQACILEGLRRYPPLGQLRERTVPEEGDFIQGHRVPGGTFIGINAWGCQQHHVFGDDPEAFRPERWLIDDEQRLEAMRRVQELVFGHGSTKCLGIQIAQMELNKIFFEVSEGFGRKLHDRLIQRRGSCLGIGISRL